MTRSQRRPRKCAKTPSVAKLISADKAWGLTDTPWRNGTARPQLFPVRTHDFRTGRLLSRQYRLPPMPSRHRQAHWRAASAATGTGVSADCRVQSDAGLRNPGTTARHGVAAAGDASTIAVLLPGPAAVVAICAVTALASGVPRHAATPRVLHAACAAQAHARLGHWPAGGRGRTDRAGIVWGRDLVATQANCWWK